MEDSLLVWGALKEAGAQCQLLFRTLEKLPLQVCVLDRQLTIVYTNQAWRHAKSEIDCERQGQCLGQPYFSICDFCQGLSDQSSQQLRDHIKGLFAAQTGEFELKVTQTLPVEDRFFRVQGEHEWIEGAPYVLLFSENISREIHIQQQADQLQREHQQTRQALRKSHLEFAQFARATTDIIARVSEDDRVLFVNQAVKTLLDLRVDQVQGRRIQELPVDDEAKQDFLQAINRVRRLGRPHRKTIKMENVPIQRFLDTIVVPEDSAGNGAGPILTIVRDITHQKMVADGLHESELLTQSILDSALDVIILIDRNGVIHRVNTACESVFGYTKEELVGQPVTILMPDSFGREHQSYIDRYLETGDNKVIGIGREVTGKRKSGSEFPLHLSVQDWTLNGTTYFTGVIHDLTEAKAMQNQLIQTQKLDAIGRLSGGIAHDFNNVLNLISANLEMLLDRPALDSEVEERLLKIRYAARKGGDMIQRLLSLTREQGKLRTHFELNSALGELSNVLERTLSAEIKIQLQLCRHRVPVYLDQTAFENAIINLAVNAKDAMPEGGVLTIKTQMVKGETDSKVSIDVSVADTGMGIAEDQLAKIFEPFYTSKPIGRGTGLGLAQVNDFVTSHEGNLRVESELGQGTLFVMRLPMDDVTQPEMADERNVAGSEAESTKPLKQTILVVDDETMLIELLTEHLVKLGYRVVSATDVDQALSILQDKGVDLILTDYDLTGSRNGLDLAREARALGFASPIILVTAQQTSLQAFSESKDITEVVAKPFRLGRLAVTLRHHLRTF